MIRSENLKRNVRKVGVKVFPDINVFYVDFPEDLVKNRKCYESVGFKETSMRKGVVICTILFCLT